MSADDASDVSLTTSSAAPAAGTASGGELLRRALPRKASRTAPGPIIFASYTGIWGGAERALLDTLLGLQDPAVLLCPDGQLAERARSAGVPVFVRPRRAVELRGGLRSRVGAALRLVAHASEVHALVRAAQPRAVVAWNMRSAIACAAALSTLGDRERRPPLIFQHSDFLPAGSAAKIVRVAARAADCVIANSAAVARDIDPRGRCRSLSIAHPGIDVSAYSATPLPPDAREVLLLGAIVPWKRPDLALEAVALAARELPHLRLVIAGHPVDARSEELLSALRRRAARPDLADRVQFAGDLADPREALARSWCLLHCADREPFGLVVLEAMASGRAVVASAAGGPEEIVEPDFGRLYPPGDATAAARALVDLLSDRERAARAGKRAREHVKRFERDTATRWWRSLISEFMPPPPEQDAPAGQGLTLVAVTHNSERDLARLLRSVARHLPGAEVVVADSGSHDSSVAIARGWPGRATVVELGENVGFGRAANAGVAVVKTPACVVVNPDVELVDDSVAALAAEATRPDAPERLLAPLVLRPDGTRQDSVHREPVSSAAVIGALVPPAAIPGRLRRRLQPWRSNEAQPVAWAVGCCVAGQTQTLAALGPFSDRIVLYGEDLELGLRARDAGVETWWWPSARVIHYGAHAARRVFGAEPFALLARQRRAVISERRGPRAAQWDDRLQLITFIDRIAIKKLLGRPSTRERRQLAALRGARRAPARYAER